MKKRLISGLIVLSLLCVVALPAANAINLGDVLKVGGIGFLVDRFSTPINNFINTLTVKHGAGSDFATKVVPILSLGSGGYIGAVQVIGPQNLVNKTEAVVQIEGNFSGTIRVKALIPIDSKNPVNFSRVNGVGVSALVDFKI